MLIRSFIALPVPHPLTYPLGDEAARMAYQDKANAVRWVPEQNYHVTLAFLGDCELSELNHLADQLQTVKALGQTACLKLNHLSPFPESNPKLLAAILDKTTSLVQLHSGLMSLLRGNQFSIEKRRFTPHITLGRFRHGRTRLSDFTPSPMRLTADVDRLIIYESILTPSGAEYEPLYEFELGNPQNQES